MPYYGQVHSEEENISPLETKQSVKKSTSGAGISLLYMLVPQLRSQLTNQTAKIFQFSSVQSSRSVVSTLCDPMNCSTPGLPVHHQLPEFTQTHVHRVSDTIQPSHPLSSPSPPTFSLSQHPDLFK